MENSKIAWLHIITAISALTLQEMILSSLFIYVCAEFEAQSGSGNEQHKASNMTVNEKADPQYM